MLTLALLLLAEYSSLSLANSSTGVRGATNSKIAIVESTWTPFSQHQDAQTKSGRTRQRRAMDSRQGQHRRHYHNHPSNYYMQQQEQKQKYRKRTQQTEATLWDVWLCYAFALGWSMWFLSSFLNTDLMRFAESESVLVHGNVREVSIEDDSLGTGTYEVYV